MRQHVVAQAPEGALGMGQGKWAAMAIMALAAWGVVTPSARASDVDGTWKIKDVVLDIFECHRSVCGKIVWAHDPKRRPVVCGRTIVWGLTPSGPSRWTGGSIYDPDDDATYNLSASLETNGTMEARIYRGIPLFGKTEVLSRIPPRSLDGWC
jgi:uncharacterized protein (DUF2147 family)